MAVSAKSKPKAKAKAKAKAMDIIVDTSVEIESLTKIKALNMAKRIAEENGLNDFRLGGVISVIQANDYWAGYKGADGAEYSSLKEYLEGEFNLQYRKAMYLVAIYNNLVEADVPWDKVKDIGWTKLKEIASLVTPDTVDEWVERAKSMTVVGLVAYIKALDNPDQTGSGGAGSADVNEALDNASKVTTLTLKVHEDQKTTIDEAIENAKKAGGTEHNAVAMEYICMQYLEGKLGKPKKAPSLKSLLAKASDDELFPLIEERFDNYDIQLIPKD